MKGFIRQIPCLLGLFLLGLLPYLYLPIRSAMNPPLDWGNPQTLRQFVWVVSAAQYRGSMFSGPLSQTLAELNRYRIAILNEFTIPGCLIGFIGVFSLFSRTKAEPKQHLPVLMLLLLIFLADVIYTVNSRGDCFGGWMTEMDGSEGCGWNKELPPFCSLRLPLDGLMSIC